MRELAILTFVSLDGVMQGPTSPEEDPSLVLRGKTRLCSKAMAQ